jgi:hypothetical protein
MSTGDWHGYEMDVVFDCGHINRAVLLAEELDDGRGHFKSITENEANEICHICGARTKTMDWNAGQYSKYIGILDHSRRRLYG